MKKTICLILAIVLCLAMAACGAQKSEPAAENQSQAAAPADTAKDTAPAATQAPAAQAAPAATEEPAPAKKHVELLRVGTTGNNESFKYMSTASNNAFATMNANSFCAGVLWERDVNGDIQPASIKDFSVSDDDRTITFILPENLYWHDGVQVTSEDIVFTFEYGRDVQLNPGLSNIETEIVDDYTCKVTFTDDTSAFAYVNRNATWGKILPKHIWEKVDNPNEYSGEDEVIGCGPYRFVSVDKDAQISYYEAVDNYWKGEITVDKVSVKTYGDQQAELMGLINDEIDAIFNYSGTIASTLFSLANGEEDVDLGISSDSANYMIMFGYNEAPSNDLAFRKSVVNALSYDLYGSTIYGEYYDLPTAGLIPSNNMAYNDTLPELHKDVEEAKRILDEAGYVDVDGDGFREFPDGSPMDVLITPQNSRKELMARIATIIESDLKEIGVKTTFDEEVLASREAWSARCENGGTYQIYIGYCTSGMAAYIGAPMYVVNYTETGWWGTWQSEAFMDAYSAITHACSFDAYKTAMKDMQALIAEEFPAVSLAFGTASYPYRTDKYEGWSNYPGWGVINNRTWYDTVAK